MRKDFFEKKFWYIVVGLALIGVVVLIMYNYNGAMERARADSNDNVWGWAWSTTDVDEGIGWISFSSFNCDADDSGKSDGVPPCPPSTEDVADYGVNIEPAVGNFANLTGYAYFDINDPNTGFNETGWIDFDPQETLPLDPYPNCGATCPGPNPNYSARVDMTIAEIKGWARACNVFQVGCAGALKSNDARGGWDGWILMGPIRKTGSDYGVWLDTSMNPAPTQFKGWAWGSDGMGWISFNCLNNAGCLNSDYKVETSFVFNSRPNPPNGLSEDVDPCAWGTFPQAALGYGIKLSWVFTDPDVGDTQQAYEIEIDNNSGFNDPKFNYKVDPGAVQEYSLNLCDDDTLGFPCSDWLASLNWNTFYWWRVRVKDTGSGVWSNWSAAKRFTNRTPIHAYPNPEFTWLPDKPAIDELTEYCAFADASCPPVNVSECYDGIADCSGATFNWTLPNPPTLPPGLPMPGAEFDVGDNSATKNPGIIFKYKEADYTTVGETQEVKLEITDSDGFACDESIPIGVKLGLPEWIEIPPD